MKSNLKAKIIILITVGIFLALLPINTNIHSDGIAFDNEILKTSEVSGKISINGNSGWASFKAAGNCTGDGTSSVPYVIEDLEIDGGGSGNCIWIGNSDVYFEIENCTVYNSGSSPYAGISLSNVTNGQLINNNCSDNNNNGIYLVECNNNTLSENSASNNYFNGITLSSGNNNTLSGNNASNNNLYGIILSSGNSNTLSGNTAYNNTYGIYLSSNDNTLSGNTISNNSYGIWLHSNSNNNTLSGNTANNSDYGITIYYSDNNTLSGNTANNNTYGIALSGNNNTLSGNTAYNNSYGIYLSGNNNMFSGDTAFNNHIGISISDSNNNTFSGNTAYNNYVGISISDSSNNTKIFLNYFINNEINAVDNGINNTWDDGLIGNSWDDYGGVDANDDGIGDTPYAIPGTTGSQDNYPIWWDAPIISIDSPTANATFSNTAPGYEFSIEGIPDSMWYTIEGIAGNFPITELNGTIDQDTWDSLDDGDITITFYAQDSESEIGSLSIIVTKNIPSTPTPGGIPGYNLFFLLGTISVVAIVISTKLKKFNK